MDLSKLSTGAKITLIGGFVLLISSFLPWYGFGVSGFGSFNINAWDSQAWAIFGVLFGVAAAVIIALKAFEVFDLSIGALKAEQITLLLGALSFVFVLLRWLTQMQLVKFGLFLGLISAAAITFGAFTAMKEAGLAMPGINDFKGKGGNQPPPPPPAE